MKKTFFIFLSFLFTTTLYAQEQWKLEKNSKGIKVFTRPVKGYDIKEFKAYTYINASPEKILDIIEDTEKANQWIDKVEKSKLIKKLSDNACISYVTLGMPIGVTDRDMVLKKEVKKLKNGGYKVIMTSAWDKYPLQEDYIRIKTARGYWIIKPEKGTTKVVYAFFSDPEGSLPSWIVNMFLVDGPYKTLTNLKKMFE